MAYFYPGLCRTDGRAIAAICDIQHPHPLSQEAIYATAPRTPRQRLRSIQGEIAGFGGLNLPFPAISNRLESEKQTPAQSLRTLFTDDDSLVRGLALSPVSAPHCEPTMMLCEGGDCAFWSGRREAARTSWARTISRSRRQPLSRFCSARRSTTRLSRFRSTCRLTANRPTSARVPSTTKTPQS